MAAGDVHLIKTDINIFTAVAVIHWQQNFKNIHTNYFFQ